jgi:GMP synthase-like glutamine amidotransferase
MRIDVLQHVPFEDPGAISDWAAARGHDLRIHHRYLEPATLPAADALRGLVVLGGPMSVHDETAVAWLAGEKAFLRTALAAGVPTLGICLGAQLIADALGGAVTTSPTREIGWYPVQFEAAAATAQRWETALPPAALTVFHWHGETFTLPPGATHLASSEVCRNQAFAWGDAVVALQFHLEATPTQLARFQPHLAAEDARLPWVQSGPEILAAAAHCAAANAVLTRLLDGLFAATPPRRD